MPPWRVPAVRMRSTGRLVLLSLGLSALVFLVRKLVALAEGLQQPALTVMTFNVEEYFEPCVQKCEGPRPASRARWSFLEGASSAEDHCAEWDMEKLQGYLKAVTGQIVRLDDVDCADDQWLARLQQSFNTSTGVLNCPMVCKYSNNWLRHVAKVSARIADARPDVACMQEFSVVPADQRTFANPDACVYDEIT